MNYFNYMDYVHARIRSMSARTVEIREPKPGLRHNKETIHVQHRFPVKGGISPMESLIGVVMQRNPLYDHALKHMREK